MLAPQQPLYQGVSRNSAAWRNIGADNFTVKLLREGVPVEFLGGGPPAPFELPALPATDQQRSWWRTKEAPRLEALGAISRLPEGAAPKHVSNAFCVPKGTSWRVVINLRRINLSQKAHKCRYESLKLLRRLGVKGSQMVKMDLQDAFYHIPIRAEDRKYFAFRFDGVLYCMNVLPFGWLNSPYYFTKIMRTVVRYWRDPLGSGRFNAPGPKPPPPPRELFPQGRQGRLARPGIKVLPYLDDFLFLFATTAQARAGAAWIRDVVAFLGLSTHPTKCVWEPTQQVQHLGITVDTAEGLFVVPPEKLCKLRRMAVGLRVTAKAGRRLVSKRDLAKFCGFAQSVKLALPPAQLFLRNLYTDVAQPVSWSGKVRLSRGSMRDLDWWASIPKQHCSAPIAIGAAAVELWVDSSQHSWGAVLHGRTARGYWDSEESGTHINFKELRAVRYALHSFLDFVRDRVVLIREDNTTTQAILGKYSSRSPLLHEEFRLLWLFLCEHNIVLQVQRVASADNLADAPSRLLDGDDYMLNKAIFRRLEARYGPHDIDLFATNNNAQLSRFFSRFYCPGSEGVDALAHDWRGLNCYGNPPYDPDLLLAVVQKLRTEQVAATLVVPYWTAQAWWQQLMEIAVDLVFLPQDTRLFAPGRGGSAQFLPPPRWQVVAVRVQA